MAKFTCPSCGAGYNGKRCRNCNYEHFSEEIAHRGHTHKGEPLVIDAPVRKPVPRKDPFGCEKKTRKKRPLAGFVVLLVLINSLLPLIRDWGLKLERIEESNRTITREPAVMPDDILTLHREEDIHIFTSKTDAKNLNDSLTVYVQNDSNHDVTVSSSMLLVNNFVIQYGSLYCEADENAIGKTWLHLDEEELKEAKVEKIQSVSFRLDAYDEDYNDLFVTDLITLGDIPDTFPEFDGALLYGQNGLKVQYLGYEYSPYAPEEFSDGILRFYLENTSGDTVSIYGERVAVNGEDTNIWLWAELPPETRTIAECWLDDLKDTELRNPADALLEISLEICRNGNYASAVTEGPFRFPAAVAMEWEEG